MEEKIRRILKENFGRLIIDKPTKELLSLFDVSSLLPSNDEVIQASRKSNTFPNFVHKDKQTEEIATIYFEYGAEWVKTQTKLKSNNC